jgi:endonuclease/exonuclease/phosphatase family metal-dependent hydrolase
MNNSLSVLTFNFISLPLISKNLNNRLSFLLKELTRIRPDIICFQELWWQPTRKKISNSLKSLEYKCYYPTPGPLFNGLLTCSRSRINPIKALNLKPNLNIFNRFIIESLGAKGYSLVELKLNNNTNIYVFNVHLSCHWGTDISHNNSIYCRVKDKSLAQLAKEINSLKDNKIIVAGDLNIQPDWWFYHKFVKQSGVKDIVPPSFQTILPTLFRLPMPSGGRTDYILLKNLPKHQKTRVKLLWSEPIPGLGQLSDHAGILAEIQA